MQNYYVIGDPIKQSLSPVMHNASFQALGIDATYQAVHVVPKELSDWVTSFRKQGGNGFNVTIPHKVAIMSLIDEIDPAAVSIGAVNTVLNQNGKLIGYNTDGKGFVASLHSLGLAVSPLTSHILLIGAGGAAKGIYYALCESGFQHITIANRSVENAVVIVEEAPKKGLKPNAILTLQQAEQQLDRFSIIINTTSVGMADDLMPLQLDKLKQQAIVCDIIYNPLETRLLMMASMRGATTQNGVEMFVRQGALAFEIWTGQQPNLDLMRKVVDTQLGG